MLMIIFIHQTESRERAITAGLAHDLPMNFNVRGSFCIRNNILYKTPQQATMINSFSVFVLVALATVRALLPCRQALLPFYC